jgi:hypothetical protein
VARARSTAEVTTPTLPTEATVQSPIQFEPGKAAVHSVTAEAFDECGLNRGHSGGNFTIHSVAIDVIGVK